MRQKFLKGLAAISVGMILLFSVSCSKDDPFSDNEYLLSAEKLFTTPAAGVTALFGAFSGSDPAVEALMQYIVHDVDVWRVTYRTYGRFGLEYDEIFNEPFASRIQNLFNGVLSTGAINQQLTTNVSELLPAGFIAGFSSSPVYDAVRVALADNSIEGWNTHVPLLLIHGEGDTRVPAQGTIDFYNEMISSGSPLSVVKIEMVPGVDHGDGLLPAAVKSLGFILEISGQK